MSRPVWWLHKIFLTGAQRRIRVFLLDGKRETCGRFHIRILFFAIFSLRGF
jgi:hypothetical protein